MYKVLKSEICGNFGPLIEHDPHWINFTILTSENNRYFKCLYKIWNKIISFDKKKKRKSKTCHRKSEEKHEFECFKSESLVFQNGYPNDVLTRFFCLHPYQ